MAQIPPTESCETCKYLILGTCRRNPPIKMLESMAALAAPISTWPDVQPTDWCGQYAKVGVTR